MLPLRPSSAPRPDARTAAGPAWCLGAALSALLLAACGYPDAALTPPPQAPAPSIAATAGTAATEAPAGESGLGTPFVVIRFGPEPVDFDDALSGAVAEALARRPDATFHLLAVTAGGGPQRPVAPSLGHAEAVLRSLAELGVPPDRVFVAAALAPAGTVDEVRLYLR